MPTPIPFDAAPINAEGVSSSDNLDFESGAAGWSVHGEGFAGKLVGARDGAAGEVFGAPPKPMGFGTLSRCVDASPWKGHAVQLTALLQLDDVAGSAGLWARVDGPNGRIDGFDNMGGRRLTGSTDWLSVTTPALPVLEDSERVCFGVLVSSYFGRVRIDDVSFAQVPPEPFRTAELDPYAPDRIRALTRLWGTAWYFDPARDQLPRDAGALDRAITAAIRPDADLQAIATTMLDELRVPGWVGMRADPPHGTITAGDILEVVPDSRLEFDIPAKSKVLVDLRNGAELPAAWQTGLLTRSTTTPDSVGIAWIGFPDPIEPPEIYRIEWPVVRAGTPLASAAARPRAVAFVVDRTTRPELVSVVDAIADGPRVEVFGETITGADEFQAVSLTEELEAWVPKSAPRSALVARPSEDPMAAARDWLLNGTLDDLAPPPAVVPLPRPQGDPAVRMAGIAEAWVTLDWYSPYWGDVDVDWEAALEPALREAAGATTPLQWRDALSRFVNQARDGHSYVSVPNGEPSGSAPNVALRIVEDRVVVVRSEGTALEAGVLPGMIVATVDGEDALAAAERYAPLAGGFQDVERRRQALQRVVLGPSDAPIRLGVVDGDTVRELSAPRDQQGPIRDLVLPEHGAMLPGDILYLRVADIDSKALDKALPAAKGVIVDVRGYPQWGAYSVFEVFADQPVWTQHFGIFTRTGPDSGEMVVEGAWSVDPVPSRHSDLPVAFIADSRAISQAEMYLEMARDAHVGPIFGEHSAGVDGNISKIGLPDGSTVMFTAMRVENRDGTKFHTIGVVPDHVVHPTIAGIAAGRDEQLEAAADWLRQER